MHEHDVLCFGETMAMFVAEQAGDQASVGPFGKRLRGDDLQLADLVAAKPHRDRVVALHQQGGAGAERAAKACELLDRRRRPPKRQARDRVQPLQRGSVEDHRHGSI